MTSIKSLFEKGARKAFNAKVLHETYKAQQKYGFEIGTGKNPTWNNEADAFKHAYMSWLISWHLGNKKAKELGDMHEDETPNAPDYERNMDLWNNAIGREVAHDMKKGFGDDYDLLGDEWASDTAARKIYEKMQRGELITNPFTDRRKFENMELERLTEKDRVYSNGEYANFDEKVKASVMDSYLDHIIENDWEVPTKSNLDKKVQNGELIYVDNYTKSDGTKVNGYYRRKPTR